MTVFGVIGGYGSTGAVVVSELRKAAAGEILIGGRDARKGVRVDVLDAHSLDEFCGRCSIIVNCAGPVMTLRDRVAQAAFRNRCHYVDVAGLGYVKEAMDPHGREIADLGLSYVVSAGWSPGLTELLPVCAHARAQAQMDSVDSLHAYFSDSGDWSDNAIRDGVWHLRRTGMPKPGYFRKGNWIPAKMSEASCQVDLGDPIGKLRFSLYCMPEWSEAARRLQDCEVFNYTYLAGFRNAMAAMAIALLPVPERTGVRLLRGVFRRNRLPLRGFVVAQVRGRSQGRPAVLTSRIVFGDGRDYWTAGVVPALVARLIAQGNGVRPGVSYLSDAVDPVTFMAELRKAGVDQAETFTSERVQNKC
jgi:saccharopine dehydrogenase-like NADP-dependent oxidoreductase